MSIYAIRHIKGKSPLVKLFNEYLNGLRTPDMASAPRDSMKELQGELSKDQGDETSVFLIAFNHYRLRTLNHCLHGLNDNLKGAIKLLHGFFESGRSLEQWARENRVALVQEYGGEDDDWYDTGVRDEAGEPIWGVTEPTLADLEDYDLLSELARFFDHEYNREELIGTSMPEDYEHASVIVESQSAFSFRRMIEGFGGKPLALIQVDEHGRHSPVSLGQMIEDEINEDLRGTDVAAKFRGVLVACSKALTEFKEIDRHSAAHFQRMLTTLTNIQQLHNITPTPF